MLQRFVLGSQRQQPTEQRQRLLANQRRHVGARGAQHIDDAGQRAVQLLASLSMRRMMMRGMMRGTMRGTMGGMMRSMRTMRKIMRMARMNMVLMRETDETQTTDETQSVYWWGWMVMMRKLLTA